MKKWIYLREKHTQKFVQEFSGKVIHYYVQYLQPPLINFQVLSELTKTALKERFNKDPEEQNSEAEIMGEGDEHAMYKAIPEENSNLTTNSA